MNVHLFSLLCFLCTLLASSGFAQVEEVISFPANPTILHHRFGDQLLVLPSGKNSDQVHLIDLTSARMDTIDKAIGNMGNIRFNNRGVFFTHFLFDSTGTYGSYHIQYLDPEGNAHLSPPMSHLPPQNTTRYPPKHATICENRYYVKGFFNGMHSVWESDGTAQGTKVVFQSPNDILQIASVNEQVLIVAQTEQQYEFWRYVAEASPVRFATFDKNIYLNSELSAADGHKQLNIIGNDGVQLYFNLNDSSGTKAIWTTNLTAEGTRLFLEDWNAAHMTFVEDKFYFNANTAFEPDYQIGFRDVPQLLEPIRFSPEFATPSQKILLELAPGLFRVGSYEFGIELAYLDEQDQIRLYGDLAKGGSSSVPCNVYFGDGCYSRDNFLKAESGNVFSVLTNGKDSYYYLYQTNRSGYRSFFQMEDPLNFLHPFMFEGELYWFEPEGRNIKLNKHSLGQAANPQPSTPSNPNIWLRQISSSWLQNPFQLWIQNLRVAPKGVKFGSDGSVYAAIWDRGWVGGGKGLFVSDTSIQHSSKGTDIFVKYDAKGNILWESSLGGTDGFSGRQNVFSLDREDNLLVFGAFFKRARFGEDSLLIDRVGYYLVKLDGQTGQLLWKKDLAFTHYDNDIRIERSLTFDHNNNLYLSFGYQNFKTRFAGQSLSAEFSLQNAMASFDPDGNPRWVKNLHTPWSNSQFGSTRVLRFSEEDQHLYVAQSQGFFNVSSSCEYQDWMYFLQRYTLDGELLDTVRFASSDLGGIVAGDINSKGRFVGVGYHRGNMDIGRFRSRAPFVEDCTSNIGFLFEYDPTKSRFTLGGSLNDPGFIPLAIKAYRGHLYLLGTIKNRLSLLKYTEEGTFVGIKQLDQRTNPFDFEFDRYLDVQDGYLVLIGKDFQYNQAAQIAPLLLNEGVISILKIEDADWDQEIKGFQFVEEVPEGEDLLVFPNPFHQFLRIHLSEEAANSTHYELFTIHGQHITTRELSGSRLQELSFPNLLTGTYLLRLRGGEQPYVQKIVKN
ncbi:MAG: T9SS type A sorting domain-containing protein [Bacteroidota bacterium]